jgi:TetR/AcrR family transcriptional repressor of nem operon
MRAAQTDPSGATRVAYILSVPLAGKVERQWSQMGKIVRTAELDAPVEGNSLQAKRVCGACPVWARYLDWALTHGTAFEIREDAPSRSADAHGHSVASSWTWGRQINSKGIIMTAVHHRYATVAGRKLFYREAGPADAPAIVLLHGFPTSSFMFRNPIAVTTQNGNGYDAGFVDSFWKIIWDYQREQTPETVTPDDICREAGVTRGQFREHFADRTAVLAGGCVAAPGAAPEPPMDRALRQVDSIDALRAWAEAYVEQLERNDFRDGCVLSALAGPLAAANSAARADVGTELTRWVTELAGSLRAIRDRGELCPEADPDTLASSLLATMLGGTLLAKTMRDIAPLRSAIGAVMASVQSPATVQEAE